MSPAHVEQEEEQRDERTVNTSYLGERRQPIQQAHLRNVRHEKGERRAVLTTRRKLMHAVRSREAKSIKCQTLKGVHRERKGWGFAWIAIRPSPALTYLTYEFRRCITSPNGTDKLQLPLPEMFAALIVSPTALSFAENSSWMGHGQGHCQPEYMPIIKG